MKNKSLLAALLALLGAALLSVGVGLGILVGNAFGWSDGSNGDYYSRWFGMAFLCVIGGLVMFGAAFAVSSKAASQLSQTTDRISDLELKVQPRTSDEKKGQRNEE